MSMAEIQVKVLEQVQSPSKSPVLFPPPPPLPPLLKNKKNISLVMVLQDGKDALRLFNSVKLGGMGTPCEQVAWVMMP